MHLYFSMGWFVLGLVIGAGFGFFVAALLSAAHEEEGQI